MAPQDEAHTPGPWHAEVDDGFEIVAADGTHVVCFGHDYDEYGGMGSRHYPGHDTASVAAWKTERAANARLIAAAPDLLAALKWVIYQVDHTSSADQCGTELLEMSHIMRDAIAKATGHD